jgi:multicomponent K+:H+ antiporter subunit E
VKLAGVPEVRKPYVLVAALVVTWLLLNRTLAPGEIVLGLVLALAIVWLMRSLRPVQPRLKRVFAAAALPPLILADILRSNVGVARIVLGLLRGSRVRSGFVKIPMTMRDPHAMAVLAIIVTSTPGTVWVDLSPDGSVLTLHVLDLRDESQWIAWIKNRYEKRLMEVFE